ncbi:MAG: hypothetical protein L6Q99_16875 [Planctomycetes bacterium]|nr:hypothetical protein [Planctomycetota bacterium]
MQLAILAILVWGVVLREINLERTWGWDESMHAELPAARMVELAHAGNLRGAVDVALACDRYPFGVPVFLAVVQSITGISEIAARTALATLWCVGLLVGACLVRRLVGAQSSARAGAGLFVVVAALAPIGRLFAPTLFLEAAFATTLAFGVLAWLRRSDPGAGRGADLLAGLAFTAAFFTKFNYALLLGLGLGLAAFGELVASARRGALRSTSLRLAWVALTPAIAASWWFVLPFPGDLELGASHRTAFVSFLAGNQEFVTPRGMRILDWTTLVAPFGGFVVGVFGLVWSLRAWREPATRTVGCVLLALCVPTALHPFHLDRFLLPVVTPIWWLAVAGFLRFGEQAGLSRFTWRSVAIGVALVGVSFGAANGWQARALDVLGLASPDPQVREFQEEQLEEREFVNRHTRLPTNGLLRAEASQLLKLVAAEAGPTASIGWLGLSSELSPAALHLGLLEHGGSVERFLADAHRELDVTYEGVDPAWSNAELAAFVARFDVVFATDPPDLARRANRAFTAEYRRKLVDELGWTERELGTVEIDKGLVRYPVRLFACRPPKR